MLPFLILLIVGQTANAQETTSESLLYKVDRVSQSITISKEVLMEAKTLQDVYRFYKPEWVREYLSVTTSLTKDGQPIEVISKNDMLSQEQKDQMIAADPNTTISVSINYIPENNLKSNSPKQEGFSFSVDPDSEASYPEGYDKLDQYLKKVAIDEIAGDRFDKNVLAAIKFTVTESGEIVNPLLLESSKDEEIDKILLASIKNMPCWKPAEYSNGLKVKQDFVFTVGNMESCVVNLLNIVNR